MFNLAKMETKLMGAFAAALSSVSAMPVAAEPTPALTVVVEPSCMAVGGTSVRIEVDPGAERIIAAQFSVKYDPTALELGSISPGKTCDPASPFALEGFKIVDEIAGEVFYVALVDPFAWASESFSGSTTIACLGFSVTESAQSDVCLFEGLSPQATVLVNNIGNPVILAQANNTQDPFISCALVDSDDNCVCVEGTSDCSALDTDCRLGVCNPSTHRCETAIVNNQEACDDGNDCTLSDTCISGECVGFGCKDPSLCVYAGQSCVFPGDPIQVQVNLGASDHRIIAGQFSIQYDPIELQFVDVAPGNTCDPSSPFTTGLLQAVDEADGRVFYAVTTDPGRPSGTDGATMACLKFFQHGAGGKDICLTTGVNPLSTILVDDAGAPVGIYNSTDCPTAQSSPVISCDKPCVPVPAVSSWGIIALALLLASAAKIRFGLRTRIT